MKLNVNCWEYIFYLYYGLVRRIQRMPVYPKSHENDILEKSSGPKQRFVCTRFIRIIFKKRWPNLKGLFPVSRVPTLKTK